MKEVRDIDRLRWSRNQVLITFGERREEIKRRGGFKNPAALTAKCKEIEKDICVAVREASIAIFKMMKDSES